MSIFNATSTRPAPELPGSDSTRSEEGHTRFPFGLRNATSVYQEAMWLSLSDLEEDLDRLLKIGDEGATTCWGPLSSITTRIQTLTPNPFQVLTWV
jgi:hypothetical protein